jgi:ABC-2 type transport system ATP-binding protein
MQSTGQAAALEPVLTVSQLQKTYNNITVVDVPNLQIYAGEITGIVGNNGAGKTTLFRLLLDLVRPTAGEVFSKQQAIAGQDGWKKYTAAYIDEGFLIDYLTPEEYFYFCGQLHGLSRAAVDELLLPFADFFDAAILGKKKYIRDFSKGNQFKIGIAAALLSTPTVLILDEPFANLDPSSQLRLAAILQNLGKLQPMAIVISSHDLNHISKVCHRILLMQAGKIINDIAGGETAYTQLMDYFKVS